MSPGISFGLGDSHYGCLLSESKHGECASFECEFVTHPQAHQRLAGSLFRAQQGLRQAPLS